MDPSQTDADAARGRQDDRVFDTLQPTDTVPRRPEGGYYLGSLQLRSMLFLASQRSTSVVWTAPH